MGQQSSSAPKNGIPGETYGKEIPEFRRHRATCVSDKIRKSSS